MNDSVLTRERILEVAEDVLRRYGPTKATVVDVARVLGVSHGSVYRHFPSKAALRDAVAELWLARLSEPLAGVVTEEGPAVNRLRHWFDVLISAKRSRALDDPELFATYVELVAESRDVVKAHVDHLVGQVAQIIADGIAEGTFSVDDALTSGRAVFYATVRFHDPAHAKQWSDPAIDTAFESVWSLILRGLGAA
ncbi:MAG: TetR family transcriptional regulator [Anaerolineae bacterium]